MTVSEGNNALPCCHLWKLPLAGRGMITLPMRKNVFFISYRIDVIGVLPPEISHNFPSLIELPPGSPWIRIQMDNDRIEPGGNIFQSRIQSGY